METKHISGCATYLPSNKPVSWRVYIYDKDTKSEFSVSYSGLFGNEFLAIEFEEFVSRFISSLRLKRNRVFIGIYTEKIEENACYNDFMRFISGNSRKWSGVRYCPRI